MFCFSASSVIASAWRLHRVLSWQYLLPFAFIAHRNCFRVYLCSLLVQAKRNSMSHIIAWRRLIDRVNVFYTARITHAALDERHNYTQITRKLLSKLAGKIDHVGDQVGEYFFCLMFWILCHNLVHSSSCLRCNVAGVGVETFQGTFVAKPHCGAINGAKGSEQSAGL
jgi:hypothetical protein